MNQRDVQKLATRRALSAAAVELFSSQGYDETRIEDIAAAAGVSSRTFFLHFPSKDAAAVPDHDERVTALAAALTADDANDPLPFLREQIVSGVRHASESRIRAKRYRLFTSIPALRDRDVLADLDYEVVIAAHLASRGHAEFDARRIAAGCMGIARAALATWADDPSFDPVGAAAQALARLS